MTSSEIIDFSIGAFLVIIGLIAVLFFITLFLPTVRGSTDTLMDYYPEAASCAGKYWVCREGSRADGEHLVTVSGDRGYEACVDNCNRKYGEENPGEVYDGDCIDAKPNPKCRCRCEELSSYE